MKKIFICLGLLFLSIGIWGTTATFNFATIANDNGWTNGTAYTTVTVSPITITASGGGNNAKYYTSDDTWRMYSGGSLSIAASGNYKVTAVSSNPTVSFTINSTAGTASASFSATTKFQSITVTYEAKSTAKASITLSVAGSSTTDATTYDVGDSYTLPSSVDDGACGTKTFVGWSKNQIISPTNIKPTSDYYEPGEEVTLAATQTFYAVFADVSGSSTPTNVFSQNFNSCAGTGGNDGSWSGSIASSDLPSYSGWSFTKGNAAYQCAKFGTSSAKGSATTPSIDCGSATSATLSFRAGAWNGSSEGTTLNLSATNCTLDKSSVTLVKGEFSTYNVALSSITGSVKISFEAKNASNNRFFLDDVVVSTTTASCSNYTTSCVTIVAESNNTSYGTVSYSAGLITATPAAGYRVSKTNPYTVSPGGAATVTQTGNTFSVSATSDCTITINFEVAPPCIAPGWTFKDGTSVTKVIGTTNYVNEVIKPSPTSTGAVHYNSSDELIATVDNSGVITMVSAGTATITLTLDEIEDATDYYCGQTLSYVLTIKDPSVDIVEVKKLDTDSFGIVIEHDLPGNASITLYQKEEHGSSGGTIADSLFFSKYFEAAANVKLLAIYNGTDHDINISEYAISIAQAGAGSAASFEPTKFKNMTFVDKTTGAEYSLTGADLVLKKNTELILITHSEVANDLAIINCAKNNPNSGYEHYHRVTNPELKFNGDDAVALVNPQNQFIDLIGAGTKSGGKNISGIMPSSTDEFMDSPGGWYSAYGTSANDNSTPYAISTNRCLLIRKKFVTSGLDAVSRNTTNFVTLGDYTIGTNNYEGEWMGVQIPGSTSDASEAGAIKQSCNGFNQVGAFDYNNYYVQYDEISVPTTLDDIKQPDGTYVIPVPKMKDRACSSLKIVVSGAGDVVLNETQYDVPLIVENNITTGNSMFAEKKDTCRQCDVVILDGAVLTKDNAAVAGDTMRNVEVYAGGTFVVPESKIYLAKNLAVRMRSNGINMDVPEVKLVGSIQHPDGGSMITGVEQRIRIETTRFYSFTVPYDVMLSDIRFSSGEPAVYGTDYMIRYYDGQSRAASQVASGNWKNYTGDRLYPGIGYTIAVAKRDGHTYRELVLPFTDADLSAGEDVSKMIPVNAWGWNSGARANHIGWNYVGSPFLCGYKPQNHAINTSVTNGQLVPDPDNDGWWINNNSYIRYITKINADRSDYNQYSLEDASVRVEAFTPFFIQMGRDPMTAGAQAYLLFDSPNRDIAAAPARRGANGNSTAFAGIVIEGNEAMDNFGVVVGDNYTADYDMQADLSKEFGSKYSLKAYTLQDADQMRLAFNAVNTQRLSQPIPVGVRLPGQGYYSFAINENIDMSAFEHIYLSDNVTGIHTDLLDESYVFSVSGKQQIDNRFALSLVLKPKATPTACEENWAEHVFAEGRDGRLRLSRLPAHAHVYIYDVSGRLIADRQFTSESNYSWPLQAGVYEVRVVADGKSELIKTIVK